MGSCISEDIATEPQPRMIKTVDDLAPRHEEFLSKYKMRVYINSGDLARISSTFSIIEDEFYDTFHYRISRDALCELYNI
jgi:hypothetical protein